jgi:elongator complex protein 4
MSSFRKRNVVISKKGDDPALAPAKQIAATPGVRPSPVTGHATTSTGTESLDKLLGLGAGLALGTSLMIEEEGTTEFARSLLSCYAAEGVLQDHTVFVVGPEGSLTLPGIAEEREKGRKNASVEGEKMKIAWRYERLGNFGDRERGGFCLYPFNAISRYICAFQFSVLT